MNWLIQILIACSQGFNAFVGGDADEMFSSRCWRERGHWLLGPIQKLIDTASPLAWWRTAEFTHCEWCYYAERQRIIERYEGLEE